MGCVRSAGKGFILVLGISMAAAQWPAAPGAVTEQNDFGQVNYSERVVTATGMGAVPANATNVGAARLNAIRAAKVDAWRNLIEAVKAVRVTSETTISNNMVANDIIRTNVEAMIRGAQMVGEVKYLSDSSVEVVMSVPMSGIMDVIMPIDPLGTPPGAAGGALPPGFEVATADAPPAPATPAIPGQPITGLIIDARGLGIMPSMSPRILGQNGAVLYGPGKYPREFAIGQGVVGYQKNPEAAQADSRVAGNPVTLKGIGKSGTLGTDVIISDTDSQRVSGFDGFADALDSCHVMFILD